MPSVYILYPTVTYWYLCLRTVPIVAWTTYPSDARSFMVDSVLSRALRLYLRLFSKWSCLGRKHVQE
jgi:hypothetical protein